MTTRLSAKRAALVERMKAEAQSDDSTWTHVPGLGLTVRYTETLPTPDWARYDHPVPSGIARAKWPDEFYSRHVFLTLVSLTSKVILGVARAPWTGRQDSYVTLAYALEILDDPASAL